MTIGLSRVECIGVGFLLSLLTSTYAQAEGAGEQTLHPWLATRGSITVAPAERALVVLVHGSIGYTLAPAYLVDSTGLREAPELLGSLASDQYRANEAEPVSGRRLSGKVSLRGAWPKRASLVLNEVPNGGCAGCWTEYHWRGRRWVESKRRKWLPVWFEPSGGAPVSTIGFANGTTLWERFEILEDAYYPLGTSTFFVDPYGRRQAKRQRAEGPKACKGGVRLSGRFSGVALADGSLLSIGANCETQTGEAEYWKRGSIHSRVMSLPGDPVGPITLTPYDDPVSYCARSPKDIIIAFTAGPQDSENRQPYYAHFDGSGFTAIAPPFRAELGATHCGNDGIIWARPLVDGRSTSLWRYAWQRKGEQTWQDFTPEAARGAHYLSVSFDRSHRPWVVADGRLMGYRANAWVQYALAPLADATPCTATSVHWLGEAPVVVASCGAHMTLMLMNATERAVYR